MSEIVDILIQYDVGAAGLVILVLWHQLRIERKEKNRAKDLLKGCRNEKDSLQEQFREYTKEQAKIWRELSTTVKETRKLRNSGDSHGN